MASVPTAPSPPCLPRRGRKSDDPRMIGPWKVGRTLGKGSSGRVKIARHAKTGQYAAVKIVSKIHLVNSRRSLHDIGIEAERILLGIEREIVIMKLINHPNIMRLYDVWETSGELYMILEYIEGGELFDYIVEKGQLPPAEALDYFQQLISAMDYCHRFNIAHRDLKPENLLLDKDKNLKVADFGMAAWQKSERDLLETSCGSPHYAAPEVIRGEPYDGSAADIWSCGVILFALLAGRLPFDDENIDVLLNKVKIGKFLYPPNMNKGAQNLISKMLQVDIKKRITFSGILADPWFNSRPHRVKQCPPPSVEELAKPLTNAAEIDMDIFGNLRTLWHGASDEEIMQGLTNDKQTWEKVVYHLLMKYRSAHLESLEAENERILGRRKSEKEKSKTKKLDPIPQSPDEPPARPDAPTPRKAASRSEGPRSNASTPTAQAERLFPAMDLDRTPVPSQNPSRDPHLSAESALQPYEASSPHQTSLLSPATLLSPKSPLSPSSPIWGALDMQPIDVPEIHDENVQIFFQQIVDHLNAMQQKSANPQAQLHTPILESFQSNNDGNTLNVPRRIFKRRSTSSEGSSPNTPAGTVSHEEISPVSESFGLGILTSSRRDKENEQGSKKGRVLVKKSSLRKGIEDGTRPALADRHVQIVVPPKPKRNRSSSVTSPSMSEGSSTFSNCSQKRSWFANLFKFRPAVFELFSVQDVVITREECKRLLVDLGVHVVLTHSEGPGTLKCNWEETKEVAGAMVAVKSVAFRVDIRATTDAEKAEGGFVSVLELVQEKGPLSSFKLIHARLRREWVLDNSPMVLPSPVPENSSNGRFLEVPPFDL